MSLRLRFPDTLLGGPALSFLRGKDGLALGLGLTRNFRQALLFGQSRGFRGFGGQAGLQLRFFLPLALGLFFLTSSLFGCGLFGA
jgi:hypothetical protein